MDSVCRFLYEQLVILFHDHECEQCYWTNGIVQFSAMPLCPSVEAELSHMKYCRAGMSCQIPRCPSVRVIMSHWKRCNNGECPVALNLSTDRKRKIQLLLEAEVKSFSVIESPCQYMNKQLIHLFLKHHCEACAKIDYRHYSDLPLCHSVDTMLSHLKYCTAGMSCCVPGCSSARAIISHWSVCKDQDCPVIRNMSKDRKLYSEKQKRLRSMLPSAMRLNSDRAKNFRQTLFVMFHAYSCLYRPKSAGFDCDLPQCRTMRALFRHTETCEEGSNCMSAQCTMTRFLYIHYMACIRKDCEICWPMRSVIKQLCGTDEPSPRRPDNQFYEGIPVPTTTASIDPRELWFSAQIFKWILTKDKPLIGPPLFQRENRLERRAFRRWKKNSRVIYSWMRKPPYRWRYYTPARLQLRFRRNRRRL